MAWVDDRIYCHPKILNVSKPARWTWVASIAFSSGWSTKGRLERGEQEAIGSNAKLRRELVEAGLWHDAGDGAIAINDWDNHNSRRDERREKDRERKRALRESARLSAGQSTGRSRGQSAGTSAGHANGTSPRPSTPASAVAAHVDGSEGKDREPRAVRSTETHDPDFDEPNGPDFEYTNMLQDMPL